MRPLLLAVLVSALGALAPADSSAVNITLAGPTAGPLTGGIGVEDATGLSQITFTVGLDVQSDVAGYDLSVAWDPTELDLVAAQQLFPDTATPVAFSVSPVGGSSSGTPVAAIAGLSGIATTLLFNMTFDVLGLTTDGAADVRVFVDALVNDGGISPSPPLTIDNLSGVGFSVVPEPATALLIVTGLVGLGLAARRAA